MVIANFSVSSVTLCFFLLCRGVLMAKRKRTSSLSNPGESLPTAPSLLGDIRALIESARQQTARAVNSTLVMMYWQIGRRIRQDVLENERAEYGKEIVATLSRQLTAEYGKGYTQKGLWRMVQFAEVFPDEQIVQTLSGQLS
jgi:hypothetical protein